MAEAPTLRDSLLSRLTTEFGEPWQLGQNFRWSIHIGENHPRVNIAMDCWRTPDKVKVWVFDPRNHGRHGGITYHSIEDQAHIDIAIEWLHHYLS